MKISSIVMKQNLRDNQIGKGLIQVGWKEPGNARGTLLCCLNHTLQFQIILQYILLIPLTV